MKIKTFLFLLAHFWKYTYICMDIYTYIYSIYIYIYIYLQPSFMFVGTDILEVLHNHQLMLPDVTASCSCRTSGIANHYINKSSLRAIRIHHRCLWAIGIGLVAWSVNCICAFSSSSAGNLTTACTILPPRAWHNICTFALMLLIT